MDIPTDVHALINAADRWAFHHQMWGWSTGFNDDPPSESALQDHADQLTTARAEWVRLLIVVVEPQLIETYTTDIESWGATMERCGYLAAVAYRNPTDMDAGAKVNHADAISNEARAKWVGPLLNVTPTG